MNGETCGLAIEEFIELKPKMYLILVSNLIEYKKVKSVSKTLLLK